MSLCRAVLLKEKVGGQDLTNVRIWNTPAKMEILFHMRRVIICFVQAVLVVTNIFVSNTSKDTNV